MPTPYDHIPEELKKQAQADSSPKKEEKKKADKITGAEKSQKRLFKYRRGGVVLSEDEVKEIKAGRKKLRREMKARGIKSKREFELTASGLGLYFDKRRPFPFLWWLFSGKGLLALLDSTLGALLLFLAISKVAELRGHFTINMTDDLLKEGFTLSETIGFENKSSNLYSDPVEDAPCISVVEIPDNIDQIEGSHNGKEYFAYTFYIRNEGDIPADYEYEINVNSEGLNLSVASWVMLFEDGEMTFYAKRGADGEPEAIPEKGNTSFAYNKAPFLSAAKYPDKQFEVIKMIGDKSFYRLIPIPFVSDTVIASGTQEYVCPGDIHKYTVVLWLEGDDPDCTDDLIGGHLGIEMNFRLTRSYR